ncbi:erg24, C-14 sterol reductase [Nowakowskiella sp. JEL0407]|nr:erg24, C-14 sterol reductase [Nowakowskiella sp. JEL0407]
MKNPKTTRFEFLGIPGAISFCILIPVIIVAIHVFCDEKVGCIPYSQLPDFENFDIKRLFSFTALYAILGWYGLHIILHIIIPGTWVDGTELRTGEKLKYKLNAWSCLIATIAVVTGFCFYHDTYFPQLFATSNQSIPKQLLPLVWIADNTLQLAVSAIILSYTQAILLYLYSLREDSLLALGGNTQIPIYDFFIGRELNPRPFGAILDLKYFCELRPGLVGWALLDVAYLAKQWVVLRDSGAAINPNDWTTLWGLGVTNSAVLVTVCQIWYVADAQYFEKAILTTMDITTDGFGLMLNIGDLAWVPFTYSLQMRYLSTVNPVQVSIPFATLIFLVQIAGFYIFRSANSQKDAFRNLAPSLKKKTDGKKGENGKYTWIETESGSLLLTNGWWGMARHINYLGDWFMAVSWCLPCGFTHALPYFYAIYFGILLIHREKRDDHKCHTKYGKDWEKYTKKVPYRIIPGIY